MTLFATVNHGGKIFFVTFLFFSRHQRRDVSSGFSKTRTSRYMCNLRETYVIVSETEPMVVFVSCFLHFFGEKGMYSIIVPQSTVQEVCCERTRLWPCVEGTTATDCYLICSVQCNTWHSALRQMDGQTASCVSSCTAGCCPFVQDVGPTRTFSETISYRELARSKLSASDKWSNPIRAELLKASYLPLGSQAS